MESDLRYPIGPFEEEPATKPYDEKAWSALPDMRLPVDVSLQLLESLHQRWVALYQALTPVQWARSFFQPELGRSMGLDEHLQQYAWHSRHHVAHISELRQRAGW